jgi:hypothetical protein
MSELVCRISVESQERPELVSGEFVEEFGVSPRGSALKAGDDWCKAHGEQGTRGRLDRAYCEWLIESRSFASFADPIALRRRISGDPSIAL